LAAETAGVVWKINFQEGERVQAGQVLLEIDPETVRNYLHRDEQNVAILDKKLARYRQLEATGLISQQELDNIINSVTVARAALQTTRLRLEKSFPKAPVSGIVDHLFVDRGEYVDPGKLLLRLVQVERLKVIADVPEKDVAFLNVGQQVKIFPAVVNNSTPFFATGQIESIAYAADKMTRTYRTKISIDNRDAKLRPGMIVRARFVRQQLDHVIVVPLFAVMDRDGNKVVFVDAGGVARKVDIVPGSSIGQQVVVLQGLSAGESLIVKGQQLLVDGAKIDVGDHR
jgi:membrane fusion protein (multidrug efflux system)